MTANNNINKDSLLVLLSAKKKPANHKAYHIPWSQEIIPTSQVMHEMYLCVEDSSDGLRRILVRIARCLF